jgi:hypothetical protein
MYIYGDTIYMEEILKSLVTLHRKYTILAADFLECLNDREASQRDSD